MFLIHVGFCMYEVGASRYKHHQHTLMKNTMLIREVAEAVGLKVPASKYRENMSSHFLFGTHERIAKHQKDYKDKA